MPQGNRLARILFREERARALLAGCAGHSVLPLSQPLTAALGVLFAVTAHAEEWPVAQGGSHAIARQSGASVLGEIVDAWLLGDGLRELDDYEERIRAVSAADIRALAIDAFDESRRVEGIVRGSLVGGASHSGS